MLWRRRKVENKTHRTFHLLLCVSLFRFQCICLVSDVLVIKSNIVVLTLLNENNREAFGQAWIRSISEGSDRAYFGPGLNKSFLLSQLSLCSIFFLNNYIITYEEPLFSFYQRLIVSRFLLLFLQNCS